MTDFTVRFFEASPTLPAPEVTNRDLIHAAFVLIRAIRVCLPSPCLRASVV